MSTGSQEQHEMVLETIHPTGAEEWYCPTCGRRFLMQWPPAYNKVILDPGDENAIHSGGRGSAQLSPASEQVEPAVLTEADVKALEPFIEWMERVNLDSLWQ
jgi:hypothetical protein